MNLTVINVVTIPSDVTDVTVWPITSNPSPRVLKIGKVENYYDLKLKLRLHLDKDLREVKELIEVVKCKDTEEYLHYIY